MTTESRPQYSAGQTESASETAAPRAPVPDAAASSGRRWLLSLVGLVVAVVLIFTLPAPFPLLILVGLGVVGLVITVRDSGLSPRGLGGDIAHWVGRTRGFLNTTRSAAEDVPQEVVDARRERLARVFALGAVVLMILAALAFRPVPDMSFAPALLYTALGGVALGVALKLSPRVLAIPTASDVPLVPERSSGLPIFGGVVLLAALALVNYGKTAGHPLAGHVTMHSQFALLAGGIGLIVWGFAGAPRFSLRRDVLDRLAWDTAVPVAAIVLLAFGLRVWGLDTTVRMPVDEAVVMEGVNHAYNYTAAGLVTQVSNRLSASQVFPYWQTITIDLFGNTWTGFRMVNAVVGTLNVLAVYFLAKTLFDRRTALIAAFFLATFPPHIHFSRIAMAHITDPLFGTLALAFFARGLQHNRRLDWALAGMSLGLTQYFFEGGRLLFPPLFVGGVVFLALVLRGSLRAHWRGMVVAFVTMFFVIAPMYYQLVAFERETATRMSDSSVGGDYFRNILEGGIVGDEVNTLVDRFTFPFRVFVTQPEIGLFYGGNTALILTPLVPLFLLGVFFALWRLRSPAAFLLGWIVLAALGNSLMRDMTWYARFVVAMPALALLLAVGLRYLLGLIVPARRSGALAFSLLALAIPLGVYQASYYFGPHLELYNRQLRNGVPYDGMDAILRGAALPHEPVKTVLISDPMYDMEVGRLFDYYFTGRTGSFGISGMLTRDVTPEWVESLLPDTTYAFFIAPGSEAALDVLRPYMRLEGPTYSPFDVPDDKEYLMYLGWRNDEQP